MTHTQEKKKTFNRNRLWGNPAFGISRQEFYGAIINMFEDLKENIATMSKQVVNLSRAMETILKKNQMKF